MIKHTGNLDLNSSYSYLLWCEVFSESSIIAFEGLAEERPVGFVSGFMHPEKPDTLFIWQVAVHESQRGKGLATKMLKQLLNRECCEQAKYIEATVGESNTPSNNLFLGLARKFESNYRISKYFESDDFPESDKEAHETEWLYRIGPINKKFIKG
ncbi:diaminobutyrate acetyltransferase [Oceanobacillus luteolus]|nr:diaminobutyrate acetyltransferase [Oceanobacillus luteolus]